MKNAVLKGVGVLEFIHKDFPVLPIQIPTFSQFAGPLKEPLEVDRMESFYDHGMLPATYMIDSAGEVRRVLQGMIEPARLVREIEKQIGFTSEPPDFPGSDGEAPRGEIAW